MSAEITAGAIEIPKPAVAEYPFLLISPKKLAIMSLLTLNLYDIYWFYKNWQAVNKTEKTTFRAFLRAAFSIFFIRSLFQRMGLVENLNLAVAIYVGLAFASRLPDPWWLVTLFEFVPLMWAQQAINAEHTSDKIVTTFSTKEIVFAVIGGMFLALILLSFTLPTP